MNEQQERHAQAIAELPDALNSSGAKLVYLYVNIAEGATIDELQTALGLKKVTLYPLLQTLTTYGLIEKRGTTYVCQGRLHDGGE